MIAAYLEFVPPGGLRADLSDPPIVSGQAFLKLSGAFCPLY
jgi:hypothetical protein